MGDRASVPTVVVEGNAGRHRTRGLKGEVRWRAWGHAHGRAVDKGLGGDAQDAQDEDTRRDDHSCQ